MHACNLCFWALEVMRSLTKTDVPYRVGGHRVRPTMTLNNDHVLPNTQKRNMGPCQGIGVHKNHTNMCEHLNWPDSSNIYQEISSSYTTNLQPQWLSTVLDWHNKWDSRANAPIIYHQTFNTLPIIMTCEDCKSILRNVVGRLLHYQTSSHATLWMEWECKQ